MLCKTLSPAVMGTMPGYEYEKLRKIRDKIRIVFGRECVMDDTLVLKRYTLTESGDLVMIL